jgi:chemotaxis protein MotB
VTPLVLVGCVSQAKYDDLKQRYDAAQEQIGKRQQRIGSLGASLSDAQAEIAQRKLENANTSVQLAALEEEREQLSQEQRRLVNQLTQVLEDRRHLKESTQQLQTALLDLTKRKAEADRRVAEFKALVSRFKSLIDAGTLKVTIADGRMVLQLPTDVLFDSGSAKLSKPGKAAIAEVAAVLKEDSDRRYQVEGHTDNVPIHNAAYTSNWELAAARGLGVVRAMVDAGVDSRKLSAASYGEFHPAASNDSDNGRAENRRIEITLVPDLSMLPGYQELQQVVQSS